MPRPARYTLHAAPYNPPPTPYALHAAPCSLHPTLYTLTPTLNLEPKTLYRKSSTLNPRPQTPDPRPQTLNLKPQLPNPIPLGGLVDDADVRGHGAGSCHLEAIRRVDGRNHGRSIGGEPSTPSINYHSRLIRAIHSLDKR